MYYGNAASAARFIIIFQPDACSPAKKRCAHYLMKIGDDYDNFIVKFFVEDVSNVLYFGRTVWLHQF